MSENFVSLLLDTRKAEKQGLDAIRARQRKRLAAMVAFARAHSPYYREHYRELPEHIEDPTVLPITSKKTLMGRFDEWVTDRAVTLEKARAFIDCSELIGERFLGQYTAVTTSGTTGIRGIFVMDERSFKVTTALAVRMLRAWLNIGDVMRIVARSGHLSMIMATGGHFASAVAAARLRARSRWRAKSIQVLSVHMSVPELVAELNRFQPVVVAPYASVAALLATEQEAGRLSIAPILMTLAAEGLPAHEYARIARAFHCRVGNSYAATECPFLSYSCEHGWLHVNSDWLILEPVDANFRPMPAGELSHTVLISNLANQVQPILRYDLGDRVVQRPDSCPCGSPLPAIQVKGRSADVLTFTTASGERISLPPLAFEVDHLPGVEQIQVVQRSPTSLRVRLRAATNPDRVWGTVQSELRRLLADHGLAQITVERAEEPPEQSPGGKYRAVIPLT